MSVDLKDCIAPSYYSVFNDIENKKHSNYWFKGGRGSLKSSFVFITVILNMTKDYTNGEATHCVALRKVKDTIKDSIFVNLIWAIDMLGLTGIWRYTTNPMKLYLGDSTILFRGCANKEDHQKLKSLKFKSGYCKYGIFEEVPEFTGMDEIRSINQSIFRGGNEGFCFYMYNPPPSKNSWINKTIRDLEIQIQQGINKDTYIHSSTYLEAPVEWLGKKFINDAEQLKLINLKKYNHMYLAEEVGEGLEIYPTKSPENPQGVLTIRPITDFEIKRFDKVYRGIDFGYSHATCYVECFYDKAIDTVFIFDEIYVYKPNNNTLATKIKNKAGSFLITGDSASPSTINELNQLGLRIVGARKGQDSKAHGIKWLQDRAEIVIDKKRCPNVANDFETYEYKKDKEGNINDLDYPEEPDGSAAVRYALENIMLQMKWVVIK